MSDHQAHDDHQPQHSGGVDYERKDAKPLMLGITLTVGLVLLGISLIGINEMFILTREKMVDDVAMKPESSILRDVRAHEEQILTTYGVVDSAKNVYRIPIERAMQLMADEAYTMENGRGKMERSSLPKGRGK